MERITELWTMKRNGSGEDHDLRAHGWKVVPVAGPDGVAYFAAYASIGGDDADVINIPASLVGTEFFPTKEDAFMFTVMNRMDKRLRDLSGAMDFVFQNLRQDVMEMLEGLRNDH